MANSDGNPQDLSLGNLVRLHPLHINELPAHPVLESMTNNATLNSNNTPVERPNLVTFIEEVLDQATIFAGDILPATFKQGPSKSSPPSTAEVRLLSKTISPQNLESVPWVNSRISRDWTCNDPKPAENWFARRSQHANQSAQGTASLGEFDWGLRHDHPKKEQEYTPDVFDSYKVLDWDEAIKVATDAGANIDNYSTLSMSIYEMCHKLPALLSNRVFGVLIVTAKRGKQSFIVVQIPVDISSLSAAFYSNGRNMEEGDSSLKRKKPVFGVYTSVETGELLQDGHVEWVMATASDAKGWLPMWAQKLGVPSAVVKDVGLFIEWIRQKQIPAA